MKKSKFLRQGARESSNSRSRKPGGGGRRGQGRKKEVMGTAGSVNGLKGGGGGRGENPFSSSPPSFRKRKVGDFSHRSDLKLKSSASLRGVRISRRASNKKKKKLEAFLRSTRCMERQKGGGQAYGRPFSISGEDREGGGSRMNPPHKMGNEKIVMALRLEWKRTRTEPGKKENEASSTPKRRSFQREKMMNVSCPEHRGKKGTSERGWIEGDGKGGKGQGPSRGGICRCSCHRLVLEFYLENIDMTNGSLLQRKLTGYGVGCKKKQREKGT